MSRQETLDEQTAGDIIAILKKLAKERQKCVIVVTHGEVAEASDVVLELVAVASLRRASKEGMLCCAMLFAYITRKWPKSLLLFAIILLMGTLSLIGLSMKGRPKSFIESLGSITSSFSMQINRRTNPGTHGETGNLRGEDIEKSAR